MFTLQRVTIASAMIANIKALFCRWTPWESLLLAKLCESMDEPNRAILRAQIDAVTKIQRIVGWSEIDLYVIRKGRVCWDGVPAFEDKRAFLFASVKTTFDSAVIFSRLHCVSGHLFSIESNVPVKPYAFRTDGKVEIQNMHSRYSSLGTPETH
jgi:hypothetical protein